MQVIAAVIVASNSKLNRRASSKNLPDKLLHLRLEKEKLEHELTTNFPVENDIKFNKVMELLMMNGFVCF